MTVPRTSDSATTRCLAARLVVEVAACLLLVGTAGVAVVSGLPADARPWGLPLVGAVAVVGGAALLGARARARLARPFGELVTRAQSLERARAEACIELARRDAELGDIRAELRRAHDAARRAEGARSRFLATMSHELRTPLNGVLGMAGLLAGERLPGEPGEWAEAALVSARDLARQLDGIFDWIAIEDEALVVERRPFHLDDVREHLERELAPRVEARGLAFTLRFQAGLPKNVHGDRRRLGQILEHLVDNACKFTPAGRVKVDVRRGEGDELVFEVHDTGTGFDERALAQLFEPFSPADATTTRRFDGAGLGLALAQRIAGLMRGRLEVDSDVRSGACVRLVVRLEPATERRSRDEPALDASAPTATRRILVVDDNPVNRRLVAAVVRRAGHEPLLARDGLEAVERFRVERPDLVLMDCFMPGLDGLGATRRIRELELRRGASQVPVVALTAGARRVSEAACREAGMDGVLEKPVGPGELVRAIAEYVRRADRDAA